MKTIYVIETMNLLLYCLFIGGIIYHIRWLRTNKDLVNDVRNLTAYDIRFPVRPAKGVLFSGWKSRPIRC